MIAYLINSAVLFLAAIVALVVQVWALVDCLIAKPREFEASLKRTKGFWTGITAVSAVVGFIYVFVHSAGFFLLVDLAACVGAGVYLADVRPALRSVRGSGGRSAGPYGR